MKSKNLPTLVLLTLCLGATCVDLRARDSDPDTEANRIRGIENKRLLALVEGRVAAAKQYHAADFKLISPGGMIFTRDEYLGTIASGKLKYLVFEAVSPIEIRFYGAAAVLRYRSSIQIAWEGKEGARFGCWHTDLYELHDGQWQIVWSQVTGDGTTGAPTAVPQAERGNATQNSTPPANVSSADRGIENP